MWVGLVWALQCTMATAVERNCSKQCFNIILQVQTRLTITLQNNGLNQTEQTSKLKQEKLWTKEISPILFSFYLTINILTRANMFLLNTREISIFHQINKYPLCKLLKTCQTYPFPQPSGPTRINGCLLSGASQGEKKSMALCTSVVRITGRLLLLLKCSWDSSIDD